MDLKTAVNKYHKSIEFFTVNTKFAEMAVLASKDLTKVKTSFPLVGLYLMQEIITGLGGAHKSAQLYFLRILFVQHFSQVSDLLIMSRL